MENNDAKTKWMSKATWKPYLSKAYEKHMTFVRITSIVIGAYNWFRRQQIYHLYILDGLHYKTVFWDNNLAKLNHKKVIAQVGMWNIWHITMMS